MVVPGQTMSRLRKPTYVKPLPAPHSSKDQLKPNTNQVMVVSPMEMIDIIIVFTMLLSRTKPP